MICSVLSRYKQQLQEQGLFRQRKLSSERTHNSISFDSNDYLSLTTDSRIASAYEYGYKNYPGGSGGSMVLGGYHPNHQAVEQAFAQVLHVDECILFSSGYAANLAVTALLGAVHAHCIIDKQVHASIYDGLRLSHVSFSRFLHNDVSSLAKQKKTDNCVIITEGLFSMSGQIAPLSAITDSVAIKIPLIVDEAHSFGILGPHGLGTVALHQLTQNHVPLRIIPLGKAYAAQGAIVAGKKEWIEALLQAGRSIIYSTAISPALAYGLLKTLDIIIDAEERRRKLMELVACFKEQISLSPLRWAKSHTAIQRLYLGCPHKALQLMTYLQDRGFYCSAVRAPTVSHHLTGLRIVLNYDHTFEHIRSLFHMIHQVYDY